jgi:hypothetical protein
MGNGATGGGIRTVNNFFEPDPDFTQANRLITGVTYTAAGAPLGACTVLLFRTQDNVLAQSTVSDGSGNYSFMVDPSLYYYCVFYKAGSPDVAGTTVNTLAGA